MRSPRFNQVIEISDWIVGETQRLATNTPQENWDTVGGTITPHKIITNMIGTNNYWEYDNYETTRENASGRRISDFTEKDNLEEIRNKLLNIMATTESRYRATIRTRKDNGALGVIKKGDQDHYIFDGGHLPRLTDEVNRIR